MKRIIPPQFRNHGFSFGLERKYIYGDVPLVGWCVWHRDTGEIVYIPSETHNPRLVAAAKSAAEKECLRLNGNPRPVLVD